MELTEFNEWVQLQLQYAVSGFDISSKGHHGSIAESKKTTQIGNM